MFCCIFAWYFYIEVRLKYEKNILLSSSRAFSLSTPIENSAVCLPLWKTVRIHGKKLQNATTLITEKRLDIFCHNKTKMSLLFFSALTALSVQLVNHSKTNGQTFCEKVKLTKIFNWLHDCREVLTKPITKIMVPNQFPFFSMWISVEEFWSACSGWFWSSRQGLHRKFLPSPRSFHGVKICSVPFIDIGHNIWL